MKHQSGNPECFPLWLEEKACPSAAVTQEDKTRLLQDIRYVLYIHNPVSPNLPAGTRAPEPEPEPAVQNLNTVSEHDLCLNWTL